jgi:hypothetical protein
MTKCLAETCDNLVEFGAVLCASCWGKLSPARRARLLTLQWKFRNGGDALAYMFEREKASQELQNLEGKESAEKLLKSDLSLPVRI